VLLGPAETARPRQEAVMRFGMRLRS